MAIDTSTFLVLVGTLAAGGAGGYYASQKHVFGPSPAPAPSKDAPKDSASSSAPISDSALARVPPPPAIPIPTCDDTLGSPGSCPAPGYSAEEGGCGALPTKRCGDFKQAMKPKVAERAVECLNALKYGERCDPMRLALCGHLALMSACPEPNDTEGGDASAAPGSVMAECQAIIQGCEGTALRPTMRDCRATLAGMSELGRNNMMSCMKTHCSDKGLLGCEGMMDVK